MLAQRQYRNNSIPRPTGVAAQETERFHPAGPLSRSTSAKERRRPRSRTSDSAARYLNVERFDRLVDELIDVIRARSHSPQSTPAEVRR